MEVTAQVASATLAIFDPHPKKFCRELVSEEAHVRLLISAERHNRRRAFTTLLIELLPGASDCYFLCLAFSRSTTAFPLLCFCSTVIRLFHLLFRGSLDFLYLLSLRLRQEPEWQWSSAVRPGAAAQVPRTQAVSLAQEQAVRKLSLLSGQCPAVSRRPS